MPQQQPSRSNSARGKSGASLKKRQGALERGMRPLVKRPESEIVFTGDRHNRHFLVLIRGKKAYLSFNLLGALVDLVVARVTRPHAFVKLPRLAVHRLRRLIDYKLHSGVGARLIETGAGEEYRLAVPPGGLRARDSLAAGFADIVAAGMIRAERVAGWLKLPNKTRDEATPR
jgi:hypothetical protein